MGPQAILWRTPPLGRGLRSERVSADGISQLSLSDGIDEVKAGERKERGYWEGGSTSSIFTPSLSEGLVQPVGSGTLPAVNSGSFDKSLQEQLAKLKLSAVPLAAGLGAGLAMPEDAQAAVQGMPQSSAEPSLLAGLARQFGLGTCGVLEGMGSGLTLGLAA